MNIENTMQHGVSRRASSAAPTGGRSDVTADAVALASYRLIVCGRGIGRGP